MSILLLKGYFLCFVNQVLANEGPQLAPTHCLFLHGPRAKKVFMFLDGCIINNYIRNCTLKNGYNDKLHVICYHNTHASVVGTYIISRMLPLDPQTRKYVASASKIVPPLS